jgi:hypothetical protein
MADPTIAGQQLTMLFAGSSDKKDTAAQVQGLGS